MAGTLLDFLVGPGDSLAVDMRPTLPADTRNGSANDVWIEELRQPGPRREAALADLRATRCAACASALAGRAGVDDAFLEDAVQERS